MTEKPTYTMNTMPQKFTDASHRGKNWRGSKGNGRGRGGYGKNQKQQRTNDSDKLVFKVLCEQREIAGKTLTVHGNIGQVKALAKWLRAYYDNKKAPQMSQSIKEKKTMKEYDFKKAKIDPEKSQTKLVSQMMLLRKPRRSKSRNRQKSRQRSIIITN